MASSLALALVLPFVVALCWASRTAISYSSAPWTFTIALRASS